MQCMPVTKYRGATDKIVSYFVFTIITPERTASLFLLWIRAMHNKSILHINKIEILTFLIILISPIQI